MKKLLISLLSVAALVGVAKAEDYPKIHGIESTFDNETYTVDATFAPDTTEASYWKLGDEPGTIKADGDNKYLELDGEATRYVLTTENAPTLTAGNEIYFQGRVQFTASETAPKVTDGDKIILWLYKPKEGDVAPRLMVTANSANSDWMVTGVETNYALVVGTADKEIASGSWHTVKIQTATAGLYAKDTASNEMAKGFKIFIDDELATVQGAVFGTNPVYDVIPSLADRDGTIKSVTFNGKGGVDSLKFEEVSADYVVPTIEFSITVAEANKFDVISWSTDGTTWTVGDSGETTLSTIYVKLTNTHGAEKIIPVSVDTTITVAEQTFGWAEYLGAAIDENTYGIDSKEELVKFQAGVNNAKLETAGLTFKLDCEGESIDMTGVAWTGIGFFNTAAPTVAFQGIFDGNNKKIINLTFDKNATFPDNNDPTQYRGFFNAIVNATVKNVTVVGNGFGFDLEDNQISFGSYGGALLVSGAFDSTIQDCVAEGSFIASHNVAGILCYAKKNTTVLRCKNKATISNSDDKMGGVVCVSEVPQNDVGGSRLFESCVNEGELVVRGTDGGKTGVGGVIGYVGYYGALEIKNCENKGLITVQDDDNTVARCGQLVGCALGDDQIITASGTNKGLDDTVSIAYNGQGATSAASRCDGIRFATVDAEGVATYVANSAVVAGGSYLVTAIGQSVTVTLEVGQSIAFDKSLVGDKFTATINGPETGSIKEAVNGDVITYTAEANKVQSIEIAADKTSVTLGEMVTLSVTVDQSAYDATYTLAITEGAGLATLTDHSLTCTAVGTVTVTATANDGSGKSATVTITVAEAGGATTEIAPGGESVEYASEADAQAAISGNQFTIKLSTADSEAGMTAKLFKLTVKASGTGYVVVADLDPAEVPAPEVEADATTPAMQIEADTTETSKMNITVNVPNAVQGVWYGFESGEELSNMVVDPATFKRAGENGVKLSTKGIENARKYGSKGFFRVKALPKQPNQLQQ